MTPEIAGFHIERVLGRGGFAAVHLATTDSGRVVALKVLRSNVGDTADLTRFERERLSMSALGGHPHIVGVIDSGETSDGHHWMALEYVDGGSIRDQLAGGGAMHWSTVTTVGVQLCSALDAAHRTGVLHRDIKPANILWDGTNAKLTDFGIARLIGQSELTAAQSIIGTLAYTPPEVLHNHGFDGRGDIYQLGISLYEMLLGRAPFRSGSSDNKAMVIRRILENPAPPLAQFDVPQPLSDLLDDVLAKDPADRPQTAAEFGQRLRDAELALGRAPSGAGVAETVDIAPPIVAPPVEPIRTAEPTPAPAPTPKPTAPPPTPPVVSVPAKADPDRTVADLRPDHTQVMPQAAAPDPAPAAAAATPAGPPPEKRPSRRSGRGRTIAVVVLGIAALAVAVVLLAASLGNGGDDDPVAGPDPEETLEIEPTLVRIEQGAFGEPGGDVGVIFGAVANQLGLTTVGGVGDSGSAIDQQSIVWTMNGAGDWVFQSRFASGDGLDAAEQQLRGIGLLDSVAFLAVGEGQGPALDGVAWIGGQADQMQPTTDPSFTGAGPQRLLAAAGDNARGEFLVAGIRSADAGAVPGLWVVAEGTSWQQPVWAVVPIAEDREGGLTDVAVAGEFAVAVGWDVDDGTDRGLVLVRTEGRWARFVSPVPGVQFRAVDVVGDRIVAVGLRSAGGGVEPVALVAALDPSIDPQLHVLPTGPGDGLAHDVVATRAGVFAVGTTAEVAGSGALRQGLSNGAIWQFVPGEGERSDAWTTRDSDQLDVAGRQEFWSVVEYDGAVFALGTAEGDDDTTTAAAWTVTVDLGDRPDEIDDAVAEAQREAAPDEPVDVDGDDSPLGVALSGCAAQAIADARSTTENDDLALRPVVIDATDRFALWICRDDDGGLWYHGADRQSDDNITLAAVEVTGGYEAENPTADGTAATLYRVVDGRLTVINPNGSIALDQPLLDN